MKIITGFMVPLMRDAEIELLLKEFLPNVIMWRRKTMENPDLTEGDLQSMKDEMSEADSLRKNLLDLKRSLSDAYREASELLITEPGLQDFGQLTDKLIELVDLSVVWAKLDKRIGITES